MLSSSQEEALWRLICISSKHSPSMSGEPFFDWHHTIRDAVERLAQARGVEMDCAAFTNGWRWRMFELLGQVRSGDLPWMNAEDITSLILKPTKQVCDC